MKEDRKFHMKIHRRSMERLNKHRREKGTCGSRGGSMKLGAASPRRKPETWFGQQLAALLHGSQATKAKEEKDYSRRKT